MENKSKKIYYNKTYTYEELLEQVEWDALDFRYKGRAYIITFHMGPCITVVDEGSEVWFNELRKYDTYDELLKQHVMNDGVPLLEALKTEDVQPY